MTKYVALLRGINVNDGITIAMSDLGDLFRELGFSDVHTVLASGNVLFRTGTGPVDSDEEIDPKVAAADVAERKAVVETALRERFGYEAGIVLVEVERLDRIIRAYPFDGERDGWQPYVMFASDRSALTELAGHARELDGNEERIELGHGVLYWEVRKSVGAKSHFSKKSGKPKYREMTTTRNLHTLNNLIHADSPA
ncbi:DUF1697 domain-containing protein [Cryobacterium psychrophilum]|uniref:DUF1697 domain-containing protein n=1 Tax=Cryobacterium psychrophilum TaxID=41988 RepID=A0A4Y8KPS9_9MICO|nr:DUF1697 domain-containing protein [Cryobacterium psychrophilum]TDW31433.1 uncharacterized protein (DUF1697 family) [Cryobacterium psychrophilum]TFD78872.1 DUF1697 domain-containing protein [Cryobacterium psychrophilum]